MPQVERALEGLQGVRSREVRFLGEERGTIRLRYDPTRIRVEEIVRAVEKIQSTFLVTVGSPEAVPRPDDYDFRVISAGGAFEIGPNLAKGKPTLVLFQGEGDVAATLLSLAVETLAKKRRCAVRKVYLTGDAARRQFKRDFGSVPLPTVRVYSAEGRFLGWASRIEEIRRLSAYPGR